MKHRDPSHILPPSIHSSSSSHTGLSYPLGLVVPLHSFLVPLNLTTGLQPLTTPPNPGASISNIYFLSNNLGCSIFILPTAAFDTTSKFEIRFKDESDDLSEEEAWRWEESMCNQTGSGYGVTDCTQRLYWVRETPVKYEPPIVAR